MIFNRASNLIACIFTDIGRFSIDNRTIKLIKGRLNGLVKKPHEEHCIWILQIPTKSVLNTYSIIRQAIYLLSTRLNWGKYRIAVVFNSASRRSNKKLTIFTKSKSRFLVLGLLLQFLISFLLNWISKYHNGRIIKSIVNHEKKPPLSLSSHKDMSSSLRLQEVKHSIPQFFSKERPANYGIYQGSHGP